MTMKWLPNAVMILRCVLAIYVGYLVLEMNGDIQSDRPTGLWLFLPFALFVFTAATDWLDGVLARSMEAESRLGARLDPIADKLLAASSLIALSYVQNWAWYISLPAIVIIGRDFLLTAMREALGNPTTLKVSQAAKWKTAVVLTSIAAVLFGMALSYITSGVEPGSPVWIICHAPIFLGLAGLWLAAIMSVMTAAEYVTAIGKA